MRSPPVCFGSGAIFLPPLASRKHASPATSGPSRSRDVDRKAVEKAEKGIQSCHGWVQFAAKLGAGRDPRTPGHYANLSVVHEANFAVRRSEHGKIGHEPSTMCRFCKARLVCKVRLLCNIKTGL